MIEIVNLHKTFGENHVLKGVDLTIEEGETNVIIGKSGSGTTSPEKNKTTYGMHRKIPSPETVQKRLIIIIAVIAEARRAPNNIEDRKAKSIFVETGGRRSKNKPTIKNRGIDLMIVGTTRIATDLKNHNQ